MRQPGFLLDCTAHVTKTAVQDFPLFVQLDAVKAHSAGCKQTNNCIQIAVRHSKQLPDTC